MTISQALRNIAKLKGLLKENLDRAAGSVLYTRGDAPAFTFSTCVELAEKTRKELIELQAALALANSQAQVTWGGRSISLTEATLVLRELKGRIAWYRALPTQAQDERTVESFEYDHVESKPVKVSKITMCALPEAKRADLVAKLQDDFDRLNDLVETANHTAKVNL